MTLCSENTGLLRADAHSGPRRLLFLLPFAPRLDAAHGGGRVTAQLLAHLARRHRVAVLYLRAAEEPSADDSLHERCEFIEEVVRPDVGFSVGQRWSRFTALLRGQPLWATGSAVAAYAQRVRLLARTWRPDIVQVEFHVMGQYLSALDACPAPRVLVEHEPGAQAAQDLWQQTPHGFGHLGHLLDLLAWRRYERKILTQVQTVVVFTERDQQVIRQFAPQTPVVCIPPGTELPPDPLHPLGALPLSLLFIGSFHHPPNVDAALRLVSSIFPAVRMRVPEVRLLIVGDAPTPALREAAHEHVIVTGRVPDVTCYLERAALVVVPLRLGGGMRVKVLEALAAGKAIVASPRAIAGLTLVDGQHIVVAESDQEFCEAIVSLLTDQAKRAALAAQARAWACANLGWNTAVAAYEALYERLLQHAGITALSS